MVSVGLWFYTGSSGQSLCKRDSRSLLISGTSTPGRGNSRYKGPEWEPVWHIWSFPGKQRGPCGRSGGHKETVEGDEVREEAEMVDIVGRIVPPPQRCPHLNPRKLWLCSITHQGELSLQTEWCLLISWLWDAQIILDYLGGPNITAKVLMHERDVMQSLALMEEKRPLGTQEASRSWKRQGNKFYRGASGRTITLSTPCFLAQWDPFQTLTSRTVRWWVSFILSHWARSNFLQQQ